MLKKSGHLNSEKKLSHRTKICTKHWHVMKDTEYIPAYPFTGEKISGDAAECT